MREFKNFKDTFSDEEIKITLTDSDIFEAKHIWDDEFSINVKENDFFGELSSLEIAKILKRNLPKYIYGQDHVIEKIVDYFKNNLIKNSGPKASFLFLGPPATGKTYLAETMAKLLRGYKVKIFDMTQFTYKDDAIALYGNEFKYANSKPGFLTDFVLKNPKSIIVFDEIEKAHNNIQNALLSIFNNGKMTDKCGWIVKNGEYIPFDGNRSKNDERYPEFPEITEVDFSQTILIFTSNVGKELYNSRYFWDIVKNDYSRAEHMIIEALSKEKKENDEGRGVLAITPPFLSRLTSGELLLFKKLGFMHLLKIVRNVFDEYKKEVNKNYNITISGLNDFVYALLLLSYAPRIDIRRIKSKIGGDFFDLVSDYIVEHNLDIKREREIIIEINEKVINYFKKEIDPLLKEQDDIVKYMFRKNLTLKIQKELEFRDNKFIYKINNIKFEKIKNINDIGEQGIIFDVPDVSFNDIAGHNKIKRRLKEMVVLLKNPKKFESFGIEIPKGILLYGPPGTGKTMLAKALAHESELPFMATTGVDLLDLNEIDKVFETAREYAPCIIFIDEIDALGRRDVDSNREIYINKILSKINGFKDDEKIFIIAATNYKENIDPAMLRSGRIDLHIEIKELDKDARRYFIEKIINTYKTEGEFDVEKLIIYTTGMRGADLDKVRREAGLEMLRRNKYLDEKMLVEIINTVKYGEKLEDVDVSKLLESTAVHESGHAVISKILKPEVKIEQITITPRSKALGFVAFHNEDNLKNLTKSDIKKELQILLAGRFAQIKKYGEEGIDSGAEDDLQKATDLAEHAITSLGMDEEIGNVNLKNLKEGFDEIIRNRVFAWINEAQQNIKKLIDENWNIIEKVVNKLLEEEVLDEKEFMELISK